MNHGTTSSMGEPIAGYHPDADEEQRWRDAQTAREEQERRGQAMSAALALASIRQQPDAASIVADAQVFDDFLAGK